MTVEDGKNCCFCGEPIVGYGNNPHPACTIEGARCCDECDYKIVIPIRILRIRA